MEKIFAGIVVFIGCIILIALFSLIAPIWVMPLWNWLMPKFFGLSKITYWETWGLLMLCGSLFKNHVSSSSSS